jgi:hypothetical protein
MMKHTVRLLRPVVAALTLTAALVAIPIAVGLHAPAAHADSAMSANDPGRTGWYPDQSGLTPSLVQGGTFGQLFNATVDGQVYAQPLVWQNTLLVATETNNIYGLDPVTGTQRWTRNLGVPWNPADIGCPDLTPWIGVTGTPVIDPSSNVAYFVSKTYVSGTSGAAMWQMHAVSVATGAEQSGFPVTIQGVAQNQPNRTFTPTTQMQRPGLLLLNGVVYAAFGSQCDHSPWAGWIAGVTTGGQLRAMWSSISTANLGGAGIWAPGGGIVSDGTHIYVATGNGAVSATLTSPLPGNTPPSDLGQCVVRLVVQADGSLKATDFFAPFDAVPLDQNDEDLGSSGPVALPTAFGAGTSTPNLLVQDGKEGYVYLLNRDNLGGYQQGPNNGDAVVARVGPNGGVWGRAGVWPGDGGYIYYTSSTGGTGALNGYLHAYKYGVDGNNNPTLSLAGTSGDPFGFGSSSPVITSNGTASGSALVWVIWAADATGANAQLRAYDAVPTNGAFHLDFSAPIGTSTKFATPGISGNRVYVGTRDGRVLGFGSPVAAPASASPLQFANTTVGQNQQLTATFTANTTVTVNGFSSNASAFATGTPSKTPLPVTLIAGDTISVPVTFTPTTPGLASATLTMNTNAGPVTTPMNGAGLSVNPLLMAQPTFLSMEGVPAGGPPATGSVTFSNMGSQPLTVQSVTPPTAPFTVTGLPGANSTIQPGQSVTANISFAPAAPGTYQSAVAVNSTGGNVSVPLTGQSGTPSQLTLSTSMVNIGDVPTGGTATGSFTVANTGGSPLTITISKPPAFNNGFTALTSLPEGTTIAPGGVLTETVSFTASTTLGPFNDSWKITGDDGSGAHFVTFNANTVQPQAVPGPASGGWTLNGSASLAPPVLQLTPATQAGAAGSSFSPTQLSSHYLSVAFDALIDSGSGADGLTVTFANPTAGATATSLGTSGGGLGFSGIPGVAAALDTYQSSGNPSPNFVGITDGGLTQGSDILHWLSTNTNILPLRNAPVHVVVTLADGAISMSVNGTNVLLQSVSVPSKVLLGFTGGNGGLTDRHAVTNVAITTVPPPTPTLTISTIVNASAGSAQATQTFTYSGTCTNAFTTPAQGDGQSTSPSITGASGNTCIVSEPYPGSGWTTFISVNGGPARIATSASFSLVSGINTVSFTNQFTAPPAPTVPPPTAGGWHFNGSALMYASALVTTTNSTSLKGSAFWPHAIPSAGLVASFDSTMSGGTGGEGQTFVLADPSKGAKPTSLGGVGGLLGFGGIPGIAVALDTHKNATDPSSNFVGISTGKSTTSGALAWAATTTNVSGLRPGPVHVDVVVTATGLNVYVNGTQVLSANVAVPTNVLVGFTGSTGSLTDIHAIYNVSIANLKSVPSPLAGGWSLNGTAKIVSPTLQLTDASTSGASGSGFWPTAVNSTYIQATFDALIDSGSGADGLTLTFANPVAGATPASLGTGGGGLGFSGIPGLAVALDTYQTSTNPSSNFVGISDGGTTPGSDQLHWLATNTNVPALRGSPVHVVVTLASGVLAVSVNGSQVLSIAVALPPQVLVGFTGGNGGLTDRHAVTNVSIKSE